MDGGSSTANGKARFRNQKATIGPRPSNDSESREQESYLVDESSPTALNKPISRGEQGHSNMYAKDIVRPPVPSGPAEHTRDQISYYGTTLGEIIEERRRFSLESARVFEAMRTPHAVVSL